MCFAENQRYQGMHRVFFRGPHLNLDRVARRPRTNPRVRKMLSRSGEHPDNLHLTLSEDGSPLDLYSKLVTLIRYLE